jgi:hypothetical protein
MDAGGARLEGTSLRQTVCLSFRSRFRRSRTRLSARVCADGIAYAKAHTHPELTGCTIWRAFEAEHKTREMGISDRPILLT